MLIRKYFPAKYYKTAPTAKWEICHSARSDRSKCSRWRLWHSRSWHFKMLSVFTIFAIEFFFSLVCCHMESVMKWLFLPILCGAMGGVFDAEIKFLFRVLIFNLLNNLIIQIFYTNKCWKYFIEHQPLKVLLNFEDIWDFNYFKGNHVFLNLKQYFKIVNLVVRHKFSPHSPSPHDRNPYIPSAQEKKLSSVYGSETLFYLKYMLFYRYRAAR